MKHLSSVRVLAGVLMGVLPTATVVSQCTNTSQYPPGTITPNALGAVTSINACNFQSEYAQITGINAGSYYQFTAPGSYITVHQGTFNGTVLGHGNSPLIVQAATGAD